jgi:hypothetical protein
MLPEDAMYDNMLETLAYIRFRHPRRCSRRQAHDEIEQLIPLPIVAIYCPQSEIHFKSCGDSSRKWQAKRHSSLQIGLGLPSKWIEWEDLDFHIFSTADNLVRLLTDDFFKDAKKPTSLRHRSGSKGFAESKGRQFPLLQFPSFLFFLFSSFPLFRGTCPSCAPYVSYHPTSYFIYFIVSRCETAAPYLSVHKIR